MAGKKGFSMKRDPFSGRGKSSIVSHNKYESIFDYDGYKISDLRNELLESEEKIVSNLMNIGKSNFEIAEELYNVNQKLANRGSGTYMAWCAAVGINKDRSSVLLKKYSLYLETNKKEIMGLPIPVVKSLTSKNSNFTQEDILEIVEDKKPSVKFKEIEKRYSQVANKKSCEILEAEIVETKEEKLKRLDDEISFKERDARERERNLKKVYSDIEGLKKKREEILKGK